MIAARRIDAGQASQRSAGGQSTSRRIGRENRRDTGVANVPFRPTTAARIKSTGSILAWTLWIRYLSALLVLATENGLAGIQRIIKLKLICDDLTPFGSAIAHTDLSHGNRV